MLEIQKNTAIKPKVMHNTFCLQLVAGEGTYGPRLWIPWRLVLKEYDIKQAIRSKLGKLSLWGASDKAGEHCKSWEFNNNAAALAAAQLLQDEYGFVEVEQEAFFAEHPL